MTKQQLKLKRKKDKARRDYDERLTLMNQHIRDLMKNRLGEFNPICPTCKSHNAKPLSARHGVLVGIKPCFKCKDCGRTYVLDNDSYRNVWLKLQAMCAVTFGGTDMASTASKMLYDYGINAEYTPVYKYVKDMAKLP